MKLVPGGQGLSAMSFLSYGAPLTLISIYVGAALGLLLIIYLARVNKEEARERAIELLELVNIPEASSRREPERR